MLLLFALLLFGGAAFLVGEIATYPARQKERSLKRASEYGRAKIRPTDLERLRFRERVLAPAASRFASIPLKLSPRTTVESVQTKLIAAGLSQRITPQAFLAIKGGALVGRSRARFPPADAAWFRRRCPPLDPDLWDDGVPRLRFLPDDAHSRPSRGGARRTSRCARSARRQRRSRPRLRRRSCRS